MATLAETKVVTYTLTLTYEEVRYIRDHTQNNPYGDGEVESPIDAQIRKDLFLATNGIHR